MRRRIPLAAALIAPLLAALAACSGGSDVAPEPPDLSGFYLFNQEESDDPSQLTGMPGRPAAFGGGSSMGGSPGTGIQIEQTDSTVMIDYVGGQQQRLYTDGRTVRRERPGGGSMSMTCNWKGEKLKVESKMSGGRGGSMSTVTTYWLSDDGRRLFVKTLIEGGRMQPVQFTRVYDAGSGD